MEAKTKQWLELESIPFVREPYVKPAETIIHLYIRGENRVMCAPSSPIGDKTATIYTSKVTCKNCIKRVIRQKKQTPVNR